MNKHIQILLKSPRDFFAIVFNKMTLAHCFDWMSDKAYLKLSYRVHIGKRLHLDNPKRLTEIIQWMKLYDRRPLYVELIDKSTVKQYVTSVIGGG